MSNIVGFGNFRKDEPTKKNDDTTNSYAGGGQSGISIHNPNEKSKTRHIYMYEDGFVIDDGPFRPIANNPVNQKFVEDINEGYSPEELVDQHQGPVPVALTDRKNMKYDAKKHKELASGGSSDSCCGGSATPAKPQVEAFSGAGRSLGGASPAPAAAVNLNAGTVNVDASQPTTTLRFRFHNGQQRVQQFNRSHTVGAMRAFVASVAPAVTFRLVTGFPPAPLTDDSQTLEAAGCLDTTVMQQL